MGAQGRGGGHRRWEAHKVQLGRDVPLGIRNVRLKREE